MASAPLRGQNQHSSFGGTVATGGRQGTNARDGTRRTGGDDGRAEREGRAGRRRGARVERDAFSWGFRKKRPSGREATQRPNVKRTARIWASRGYWPLFALRSAMEAFSRPTV